MTLSASTLPPIAAEPKSEFLWVPRTVTLQDGRQRTFTDEELRDMQGSFTALKRSMVIDYEHATLGTLPGFEQYKTPDGTAPAAGWVGDSEIRADGLWATNVRWTARALSALKAGEYKFTSPTIWWTGAAWTSKPKVIGPIGLVNDPDINHGLTAVAARCSHAQLQELGKESTMELKKALAGLLGLTADAPDDKFVSALETLKNGHTALTASASKATTLEGELTALKSQLVTAQASAGEVTAIKSTHAQELTALKATHTTELTALKGQLSTAQGEVSASKTKLAEVVADMLEETGRIAPADKPKVLETAKASPDVVLTAFKNVKLGAVVPVNRFEWGKNKGSAKRSKHDNVSASKAYHEASEERRQLHDAAVKYADENKCSYTDAVIAVSGEQLVQ